ncbi:fumarylacetoacetate hydrolase family protein [Aquamicrobium sp. LC103]|uniref:2-keto-4-pentenoate hydratase n=1 Tax=Aquamicrobium sp. LC103 TaxID=1120658 RepID=UPI00063EA994|nr:fumarylacetoacetate hydrolase family protein [Aquamicrobium sp. LC103]TKT76789.1 hydratase [Aquamicrobium sp. LC103]
MQAQKELAGRILASLSARRQLPPFSDERPEFDLDAAYSVSDEIISLRIARGETPVGWKIGFTNRTIWDEYDVHAPIWGPVYDSTVRATQPASEAAIRLTPFVEPRIEPEIVFRMSSTPRPGMNDAELLGCVDAVAHGFEIVQSVFPGWRFQAVDTVAAFALHGALVHGPLVPVERADAAHWIERLASFEIVLFRNGEEIDRGVAANVLDGPLRALGHFVNGLGERPMSRGILPGDLVTTGTVTRAFPVAPGEKWTTRVAGLPVEGMALCFA